MHTPYTDNFPQTVAIAAESIAVAFTAVVWAVPLRTRTATGLFSAAIALAALCPLITTGVLAPGWGAARVPSFLHVSATLATIAVVLDGPRWQRVIAALSLAWLVALGRFVVRDSDAELAFLHLFWYGVLFGLHVLHVAPPKEAAPATSATAAAATADARVPSFGRQDAVIFLVTVVVAAIVTNVVFGRVIYNGDEVAYSFQADVYGHLRAYADVPPCASMFENYWVFRHQGRAFSQYTPGWPLFMAPFQRLGVIWLAGPVMAGITAVSTARLTRRVASGLGATAAGSARIAGVAGPLGAAFAMLGPSMLLNGAARFSHTMVAACFAWAVESACVVSDRRTSRGAAWRYGILLGAATSLGLATRPADGGTLCVGVFLYFVYALVRRRVPPRALLGTTIGFACFGGLTLVILRLQLGAWFQTGYTIAPSIHPEAALVLSWPAPHQFKVPFPLATGSYCWWPAAPALAIVGLIRALGGRERRVAFMLVLGAAGMFGFYFFVEFGRYADEGLGPRYMLPIVVAMAIGSAAAVVPLVERLRAPGGAVIPWLRGLAPVALVIAAAVYGTARAAPHIYPLAYADYKYTTAPFRAAKRMHLKNAIVIIEPGRVPEHETNMAQNAPMERHPSVLFLIKRSPADEACAREHFPGRTWYHAEIADRLTPY